MKRRLTNYSFDASAKTITFSEDVTLNGFTVITNVTDNIIIYNFADPALGGSELSNVLTLDYNTTTMSDSDDLQIFYDDGVGTITVDGTVTANTGLSQPLTDAQLRASAVPVTANAGTNLNTSALALESGGNLASIKTNTDDIETLLTTIEGNQLPDGHNVTIDNASIPVTGTFWQATQPISGTVTANTGLSQPLTDTQLRATAVPVSLASVPSHNVTNAGTFAVQSTNQANSGVDIGDVTINNSTGAAAVNIQDGGNTITVDGTITANAGTDLNTSALALETGGNLAASATSLGTIDDIIYTSGDALSKVGGIGAQFDDVTPGAVTENKVAPLRMISRREMYTTIRDAAGNERGLNIDANGAIAATVTNAIASNLKTAATLDAETTKVIGTVRNADGSGNLLTSTTNALDVNIKSGSIANTSFAVTQGTATNLKTQAEAYQGGSAVSSSNPLLVSLANNAANSTAVKVNVASGGIASGGVASGALASGALAVGSIVDGANVTFGAKADARSTSTDSTAITAMQVLKEISYMEQNPASRAVTNATATNLKTQAETYQGGTAVSTTNPLASTVTPIATGEGLAIFRSIDLDETEEDIKTSAGKLFGWYIQNKNAATLYLKFYNATAANTTVGTTTPIMTIPVPTGAAANVEFTNGIAFSTALCAAVTTGVADNDTGAPAANDFVANIFYK